MNNNLKIQNMDNRKKLKEKKKDFIKKSGAKGGRDFGMLDDYFYFFERKSW